MRTPDKSSIARRFPVFSDHTTGRITEAAWAEMLDGITATGDGGRRGRRPLVVVAASGLTVAGLASTTMLTLPGQDQPRALSVADRGDSIIVRIVDPSADPKRYNAEFKKLGLDVTVVAVPVSAPWVGKFVSYSVYDKTDWIRLNRLVPGEGCPATLTASDAGCQDGVEVKKTVRGRAEIQFGRAAKPGEGYVHMSSRVDAPGEVLYGVRFRDRPVSEVKRMLAARGLTIESYRKPGVPFGWPLFPEAPGDWYVRDAASFFPLSVTLEVAPTKSR